MIFQKERWGMQYQFLRELVHDLAVHEDAARGAAALAVVEEQSDVGRSSRLFQIGVITNDQGGLAAQFQGDALFFFKQIS